MAQIDFKYYDSTSDTPAISGLNFGTNADRLCVLAAMVNNAVTINSLTIDSASMLPAAAGPTSAPGGSASWVVSGYTLAPSNTGALNIAGNMTPAGQMKSLLAASFDGIASVRSATVVGSAGSASQPSATVTTVAGDIVVLLGNDLGVYDPTITGTSGSTVISGSGFFIGLMKTASGTSTTVSGTFSTGTKNWQGVVFVLVPTGGGAAPVLSSPTQSLTAVNRTTAGATIDSGGTTGTLYALARTGGSQASASAIKTGGQSNPTSGNGAKTVPNTILATGTAGQYVDLVYHDGTNGDSNVVTVGPITTASALSFSGTIPTINLTVGQSVDADLSSYFSGTGFGTLSYSSVGTSLVAAGLSINSSTGHLTGTAGSAQTVSGAQVSKGDSGVPQSSASSNAFNIVIAVASDNTPPSLVGNIAITGLTSDGYVATCPLATDNVGVTGYQWRLGGSGAYTDIASGGRSFTFTGRTPGAADFLEMRAKDAAGNFSSPVSTSITIPSSGGGGGSGGVLDLNHPEMAFKFWGSGVPIANTIFTFWIHDVINGYLVDSIYGLTSDASGIITTPLTSGNLGTGTRYRVDWKAGNAFGVFYGVTE